MNGGSSGSTPTTPSGSSRSWFSSWSSRQSSQDAPIDARSPNDLLTGEDTPTEEKVPWKHQDPVTIERNNLVNILKLVIKEVIDSSVRFGRQLDSDFVPLQHFFIVLEHVLRHGLRPKKGLLGPKKELWDLLQLVEKQDVEATDITASVRDLPTVRTAIGRARAWLRLALMQKKLSDYFKILIEQSDDVLSEFYESRALLRSEEAVIVTGLLVSLNVVDCNLCVKEENLDSQQGVIDFSLYLRNKGGEDFCSDEPKGEPSSKNMNAVLDQKNYIEELNRHLNATVTNLEAKVETLTTTNALMKEDLSISRSALNRSQEENRKLLAQLDRMEQYHSNKQCDHTEVAAESKPTSSSGESPLKEKLAQEICKRDELQKELGLQTSMRAEMEMAMKLLEKDVHEKQDTIISLRDQLEDIKHINLELYTKLQECEKSLKHKSELISKFEEKSTALAETLQKLDEKYVASETDRHRQSSELTRLGVDRAEADRRIAELEADLLIEREWRQRLQDESVEDKDKVAVLIDEVKFLKNVASDYESLKREHDGLLKKVKESEKTLEELGEQMAESKLQVDSIREEQGPIGPWQDDSEAKECKICGKEFGIARRKHHCRNCGGIFCDGCSDNKMPLPSSAKPVRVCDNCYTVLLERFSKTT